MQGAYSYRSAFHALSSIVQQQGLPGLMKGYWATNSVWFPWNMIYIASYEKSKSMLAQHLQVSPITMSQPPRNLAHDPLMAGTYSSILLIDNFPGGTSA